MAEKKPDGNKKPKPKKTTAERYPDHFPEVDKLPGAADDGHLPDKFLSTGRTALRFPMPVVQRIERQMRRQVKTLTGYIREAVLMKLALDEQSERMPIIPPPGYTGY